MNKAQNDKKTQNKQTKKNQFNYNYYNFTIKPKESPYTYIKKECQQNSYKKEVVFK